MREGVDGPMIRYDPVKTLREGIVEASVLCGTLVLKSA